MLWNFTRRNLAKYTKCVSKLRGGHAKGIVALVYGNDVVIQKTYDPIYKNIFFNEVYWLSELSDVNFIPRLLRIDTDNFTFWMTYCGEEVNIDDHREDIHRLTTELKQIYGCYHNDIKHGNVCMRKDQLYLVDLGWAATHVVDPGYGSQNYGSDPNCFSDMQHKCIESLRKKKLVKMSE